jgi:hypothetical protein
MSSTVSVSLSRDQLVAALRQTVVLQSQLKLLLGAAADAAYSLSPEELREVAATVVNLLSSDEERLERALNEEALLTAAAPPSHEPPSAHGSCRNAAYWHDAIQSDLE